MSPRSVLLALVAAGALVAGCGGGDDAQASYARAVNDARAQLEHSLAAVPEAVSPTSSRTQDELTLGRYHEAVHRTLTRLRALDPPADVTAANARLLAAVGRVDAALEEAVEALKTATARDVLAIRAQLADRLATADHDINAAIADLNRGLGD